MTFNNAYKQNPTTFHQPYSRPFMKSFNKSDNAPLDVLHASFTVEIFATASTTTSFVTNSSANIDVFFIKCYIALTGLNKLETQSMHPNITELPNIFCIMFNFN